MTIRQGSIYSKIRTPQGSGKNNISSGGKKMKKTTRVAKSKKKEKKKKKRVIKIIFFLIFASNYVDLKKVWKRGKRLKLFSPSNKSGSTKRNMVFVKKSYSYYTDHIFSSSYVRLSIDSALGERISVFPQSNKLLGRANRKMIKGEKISKCLITALMFTQPTNIRMLRD